jgi:pimeloyl-ACP methyl ester carboxylesterase/acyl-CoA thioesterase FadM
VAVSSVRSIEIVVTPSDVDPVGHVGQQQFVGMFDRARWEVLAAGPGVDVFARHGVWPVARKATFEYVAGVAAGTRLRFDITLTHLGRTSFTLQQTVRSADEDAVVAEVECVFVCLDGSGRPALVPGEIRAFFGSRPSVRAGAFQHLEVGGLNVALDVQGDGQPVLFVHGFPLDRTVWRHLMAPLTGRRRIAPDLRGLGLSDAPDGVYAMPQYADDLVAVLDALDAERAVVCGLSMGGYIAFELIRRHPDRVAALILINSRADADSSAAREGRDEMIRLVQDEGTAALADLLMPKLLAPESLSALPEVADRVHTMITNAPAAGVIGALRAMKDRADSTTLLESITVPTLVVAGREDQLIPVDHARAMAKRIPDAQFTLIAGAGHLVPVEQPIPTSRVIAEFLDSLA